MTCKSFFGQLHVILSDNKAYITFPAYELEDCPSFMSALKYEICTLEISNQRNLCSSQYELLVNMDVNMYFILKSIR